MFIVYDIITAPRRYLHGEIIVARLGIVGHRHEQLILNVAVKRLFVTGDFDAIADDRGGHTDGGVRTFGQYGDSDANVRPGTDDSGSDDDVIGMDILADGGGGRGGGGAGRGAG